MTWPLAKPSLQVVEALGCNHFAGASAVVQALCGAIAPGTISGEVLVGPFNCVTDHGGASTLETRHGAVPVEMSTTPLSCPRQRQQLITISPPWPPGAGGLVVRHPAPGQSYRPRSRPGSFPALRAGSLLNGALLGSFWFRSEKSVRTKRGRATGARGSIRR